MIPDWTEGYMIPDLTKCYMIPNWYHVISDFRIFQQVPISTFYIIVLFSAKHPILEVFCVKNHPNNEKTISAKNNGKPQQKYINNMSIQKFE